MESDKWNAIIERGAQRQLESLPHPDLVKEAAEIIDDLLFLPLPPGAHKMRRHAGTYRVKFGGDASPHRLPG